THYLDEADCLAGRLAIIDAGRVVAEGSPDELKSALRGDAIHIELDITAMPDAARAALSRLNGQLRDVTADGRTIHARVDDASSAVPRVLSVLDAAGSRAASVTISRPSLDDVYRSHTGRTYSAASNGDLR